MKLEQRIYCIEGQWNWGKQEVEPSVEPILQMLQKMGQWNYARRDCATREELKFWLKNEWNKRCRQGSILYIASHGSEGVICLTHEDKDEDNTDVELHELGENDMLDCENCLVHFGGCNIITDEGAVRVFMEKTKATCVTGYGAEVGWSDVAYPPALALELMLFSSIHTKGIDFSDSSSVGHLKELIDDFKKSEIFAQCKLEICTKWDN